MDLLNQNPRTKLVTLRNRIAISKLNRSMVALEPKQLWVYGGVKDQSQAVSFTPAPLGATKLEAQ